ncbi:MAG TPA: NAD(P)H-binding protein [Solirubrobacteraceae bacterium]|nr:NAD(P)H-binding protein [Solirubrobacteraceae bacterium]
MDLIVGATGYVGTLLTKALVAEGRPVRALSRSPREVSPGGVVEAVRGDVLNDVGLDAALEGCDVAYYLVHSMEAGATSFEERDRVAAQNFVAACRRAGVDRVVYLGGIRPSGRLSAHMRSRLEVEQILMENLPRATGLRASIVIGAHSPSFRLMVRLIERLPVLPLPPWRERRTQPVAERDVIGCLVRTPLTERTEGQSIDLVGPEVLTYADMLRGIAAELGVERPEVDLPIFTAPAFAAVASAIAGSDVDLVRALMGSLNADVLPRSENAAREMAKLYGITQLPFTRAVRRALADWEREEPLAAR